MTRSSASGLGARRGAFASSLRIGARELRGGLDGFKIFIACLALGVMVISAVGALADALTAGFERQGRTILGGDVSFARMHNRATSDERATFDSLGRTSETATLRTMARRLDGEDQALIELKGVDALYPLEGTVQIADGGDFAGALAPSNTVVADPMLLERLGLKAGDRMKIGEAEVTVAALLKSEPDAIADRLTYGPRVFASLATLDATGLVKPGTLVRWRYAIALADGAVRSADDMKALRHSVAAKMPEAGYTALDRHNPAPQVTRTLERLRQFLVLIGLTSLLVGGVGIANSVTTFIDKRIRVVATLRSVGATGVQVVGAFLVQILAMTGIGIVIGLALGMLVPGLVDWAIGDALPVRTEFRISPHSLAIAAAYGVLVSLLFALWPLGRAEQVRASVLFRADADSPRGWPRREVVLMSLALAAALFALALATSQPRMIAVYALLALVIMLAVFTGLGSLVTRIARGMPRPRTPSLAIALRNVGARDGLTRAVILSLGTGLSLLVAVALVNAALVHELRGRLPDNSPDYFLLDIAKADMASLQARILEDAPGSVIAEAPMLRGRLVRLKGVAVEELKAPPEAQWVLNGDRGLSYATAVPEGSKVTSGAWWDADYSGPPLVSFEAELAGKLGLIVGDTVTVNVLGRNLEAKIANLREVQWENLAINFVMVFSPNALQSAPHNLLATVQLPDGLAPSREVAMVRDLAKAFPTVSAIRVRDAINQFNRIFEKVMTAVNVAGSVTLAAGALVLAGALATAQRRRILEAVILKTIGARRSEILKAHAAEYAALALAAALVATLLGAVAAWGALYYFLETPFVFSLSAVLQTLVLAGALISVFGGIGTLAVLRAPSVPYLRTE
ncbi:MAG: ABC transporter permease [Hyphomicrobium sp.]